MKVRLASKLVHLFLFATVGASATEKLDYEIEWHMIRAGIAHITTVPDGAGWKTDLHLESAGTLNRLYRVVDSYHVRADAKGCPISSALDAQEGKKHYTTKLFFNNDGRKLAYESQDLVKNLTTRKELETAPCTREILSALIALRTLNLEPGKSGTVAITDGKKFVNARVEAQARETVTVDGKQHKTLRYEAFLFDNALYKRKGRLLIWISEDRQHLPVQLKFQMGFPVGNVLVQLQSAATS